jgi:hypothetical protein
MAVVAVTFAAAAGYAALPPLGAVAGRLLDLGGSLAFSCDAPGPPRRTLTGDLVEVDIAFSYRFC